MLPRHYTTYVPEVRELKRQGRNIEAIELLLKLVEATEEESRQEGTGVAPWYYEQLAIIYRKQKDRAKEIEILKRYADQKHAPGEKPPELGARLERIATVGSPAETDQRRRVTLTSKQRQTEAGIELLQLCQTVTEDGHLSDEEIESLREWVNENKGCGFASWEHLAAVLDRILADGLSCISRRAESTFTGKS